MSLQNWQTFWYVIMAAGGIVATVGAFGRQMVARRIEEEKQKQSALEERQRRKEEFKSDIHFQRLTGHWIEIRRGVYQVGLIIEILNKDNTKAYAIHGASFQGSFTVGGPGGRFALTKMVISGASKTITGRYFLSPGGESKIKLLLPSLTEMEIYEGVPGLTFNGKWTFCIENENFELTPGQTRMIDVISLDEWQKRSEADLISGKAALLSPVLRLKKNATGKITGEIVITNQGSQTATKVNLAYRSARGFMHATSGETRPIVILPGTSMVDQIDPLGTIFATGENTPIDCYLEYTSSYPERTRKYLNRFCLPRAFP